MSIIKLDQDIELLFALLNEWITSLDVYIDEVKNIGIKAIGLKWTEGIDKLNIIRKIIQNRETIADIKHISQIIGSFKKIDESIVYISDILSVILDPKVISQAILGFSHTYSENLNKLINSINNSYNKFSDEYGKLSDKLSDIGSVISGDLTDFDIESEFINMNKSALMTDLIIGLLKCNKKLNYRMIENVKDVILGLDYDSPDLANSDTIELSKYHPLQLMNYHPLQLMNYRIADMNDNYIDLTLPDMKTFTKYNLDMLIGKSDREKFQISNKTGINFKLASQFRTITSSDIQSKYFTKNQNNRNDYIGQINISFDHGQSIYTLSSEIISDRIWHPFASNKRRLNSYYNIVNDHIVKNIQKDREIGWNINFRDKYIELSKSEKATTGECSREAIISDLLMEFEKQYDSANLEDINDVLEFFAPDSPHPDNPYVKVISKYGIGMMDIRIKRVLDNIKYSINSSMIEREFKLNQLVQNIENAKQLSVRIRKDFRNDESILKLEKSSMKIAHLHLLKTNLNRILGHGAPIICSGPAILLFATHEVFTKIN
jgi:hypothetical protein